MKKSSAIQFVLQKHFQNGLPLNVFTLIPHRFDTPSLSMSKRFCLPSLFLENLEKTPGSFAYRRLFALLLSSIQISSAHILLTVKTLLIFRPFVTLLFVQKLVLLFSFFRSTQTAFHFTIFLSCFVVKTEAATKDVTKARIHPFVTTLLFTSFSWFYNPYVLPRLAYEIVASL